MSYLRLFCLLSVFCLPIIPQAAEAQAVRNVGFEPTAFALTGARVVTQPGTVLEKATVLIRDGLIEDVGTDLKIPLDADVIDCTGLVIYPGFVDAGSSELLNKEIKAPQPSERKVDFGSYALAATRPDNRNYLSPEFLANEAVVRKKDSFEKYQKAGFTTVHLLPAGKIASGQGTLLSTSELPVREATLVKST
ncbi:MAG TPA: hypothetical protein DDZ90_34450, partial [Planctomycetaceae bacterium]|nr:hypothetical protein [Planctomycetaceae bacterium]